jgi:hypothetical protein
MVFIYVRVLGSFLPMRSPQLGGYSFTLNSGSMGISQGVFHMVSGSTFESSLETLRLKNAERKRTMSTAKPLAQPGTRRLIDSVSSLEQMEIGASTTISGIVIYREAEDTFHLRHSGEAMLGSLRTVADWIEQLKRLP